MIIRDLYGLLSPLKYPQCQPFTERELQLAFWTNTEDRALANILDNIENKEVDELTQRLKAMGL